MRARTRRRAMVTMLIPAVGLVGCGTSEEPANTPSTSSSSSSSSSSSAPDLSAPHRRQLTEDEIRLALPTLKESPEGYVEDPRVSTGGTSTQKTDPAECLAIYLDTPEMREWHREHTVTEGAVRYSEDTDAAGRGSVSVFVTSYDEPYPQDFFNQAGAALGGCAEFSRTADPDADPQAMRVTNIVAPTVGDQAFATRIGRNNDIGLGIDYSYVRSGHNVITILAIAWSESDNTQRVDDLASGIIDDLKENS